MTENLDLQRSELQASRVTLAGSLMGSDATISYPKTSVSNFQITAIEFNIN